MKRTFLFCFCVAAAAPGVNAQTWVGSTGSDTVSCGARNVDNTEIVNQQNGIVLTGGQVISYRTNVFANNGADGTPSLTASLK